MAEYIERRKAMFDFHFVYSDGNFYDIKGVDKIVIQTASNLKEIVGESILATPLPLKTMYLYTSDGCFTVSGTNLMVIDVVKQEN